jgi:hypothetical protein
MKKKGKIQILFFQVARFDRRICVRIRRFLKLYYILTLLYYSTNVAMLKSDNRWKIYFFGGEIKQGECIAYRINKSNDIICIN